MSGVWSAAGGECCRCHPPRLGGDRGGRAIIALVRAMGSLRGSADAFMHSLITAPKDECREEVLLSSCTDTVASVNVFEKYMSL